MIRNLSWARFQPIAIRDIESCRAVSRTRQFIAAIGLDQRNKRFDAYLCADHRNAAIRTILDQLGIVRVFCSAGNVVYAPSRRPSLVIAHGPSCGAVDYARSTRNDTEHDLPSIARHVDDDVLVNAFRQLHEIPAVYRAGIIVFNHEEGTVSHHIEDADGSLFRHFSVCEFIYHELQAALIDRFPQAQLDSHAEEQNPDFTLLCHPEVRPHGFNYFEVNLQKDGRFHRIIRGSLVYALSHSLTTATGSFSATRAVILAFHQDIGISPGIRKQFLEPDEDQIRAYIDRGGSVYLVMVGNLPSEKQVYRLLPS
ncbi:MAG: hypothetical protein JW781_08635 [Deltaproteobacteria bacterium]|nr:hypothetical protein [Candidatus Anaeroferrophillacea bacterium]